MSEGRGRADGGAKPDVLVLEGLGGLYNGETFILRPKQAATLGRGYDATFSVTLCRNYRRLAGQPSLGSILDRLAPLHVLVRYLGKGRAYIRNLAGRDLTVGFKPVLGELELDLSRGRAVMALGYGERIVLSYAGSEDRYIELAHPEDEEAEVEGVFMALLDPSGRLRHSLRKGAPPGR